MSWMISNRRILSGTLYIEVLPGHYARKHWGPSSVFFTEAHFFYFEPTIIRNWPTHSHHHFSNIPARTWNKIVCDIDMMKVTLSETMRLSSIEEFLYSNQIEMAYNDEIQTISELCASINEFSAWINETLENHNTIAVLGI
jgi:hypothetical protein